MSGPPLILVAEDDSIIALGLELAIIDQGGVVLGPFASVRGALAALDLRMPHAAILDGELKDGIVTPVALRLLTSATPVIIHSGKTVPREILEEYPSVTTISKPASPKTVISRIFEIVHNRSSG